ncbi:FHA domain-containing protein [Archangium sp.]|uniref:FHA domain-containing protein n=1 Tax=Archangium sp. TaxID=1872627 RepID=UPI00389AFB30
MGFQLTIARGLQQGTVLSFEQADVTIGRTAENDVVLQDGGVSRKHVRISDRLGRYYASDLGSSNGTQLNDAPLSGEHELKNGDRISLGPVELVFKEVASESDATQLVLPMAQEDADFTRPIRRNPHTLSRAETDDDMLAPVSDFSPVEDAPEPPSRSSPRPSAPPAPRAMSRAALARAETLGEMEIVVPPQPAAPVVEPEPQTPTNVSRVEARAPVEPRTPPRASAPASRPEPRVSAPLARPEPRASAAPVRSEPRTPAKAAPAPAPAARASSGAAGLSAADKARRRRELGDTLGGQLALWWVELPRGGKIALLTVATCFLVGMLGALTYVFRSKLELRSKGPEPVALGLQAVPDSFGLGEGVTWEQPDMKAFDFEFVSPTRAVVVLRYQASGISKEEVSLSVNATTVGWVPPDTINSAERELQLIISPTVLKRNERNQLVFDNVHNPPGQDGWKVWNLRLEVIPVPALTPEALLEAARDSVAKARSFYDRKDVGSENLSLAWENYRSAWITLEALDEKPDLYQDVRYMLGQVAVELDQKCGQLLLDFQRNIQFKDRKRAAQVLAEINRRFPTPAHRCHNLAAEKASEYRL